MAVIKGAPKWTRDEDILALELYLHHYDQHGRTPAKNHKSIRDLSEFLRKINDSGKHFGQQHRSINSVRLRLENYKAVDPHYTQGKDHNRKGLAGASKSLKSLWDAYMEGKDRKEAREEINRLALSVRQNLKALGFTAPEIHDEEALRKQGIDDISEAQEGRLLTRLHIYRERDGKLIARKKEQALDKTGRLKCEACTFDFAKGYGDHGKGFIEVHHTLPLHTLTQSSRITLADLALLCSNCHRMVHRKKHHWLTMRELHALVQNHPHFLPH